MLLAWSYRMPLQHKSSLTPEDYLIIEREAEYKSEYFAGEIFAMAGASERHVSIVANLMYLLVGQLKGRPCKTYANDMRLNVSPTGLYTYPDIIVVCGDLLFADEHVEVGRGAKQLQCPALAHRQGVASCPLSQL